MKYEKNLAQAEILISRMQVNPHFISNSLNAINLLIQQGENKKAEKYLVTFSRFIRMILEMPKNETISLEEELTLNRYYLQLEEKRFDYDFTYHIENVNHIDLEQIRIPPLLLQPFVENAIWHGLLPSEKPQKTISIKILKEEQKVKIYIDDNGIGRQEHEEQKTDNTEQKKSLGMKITKERIRQYNENYHCKIELDVVDKPKGEGTLVILTLNQALANTNTLPQAPNI